MTNSKQNERARETICRTLRREKVSIIFYDPVWRLLFREGKEHGGSLVDCYLCFFHSWGNAAADFASPTTLFPPFSLFICWTFSSWISAKVASPRQPQRLCNPKLSSNSNYDKARGGKQKLFCLYIVDNLQVLSEIVGNARRKYTERERAG